MRIVHSHYLRSQYTCRTYHRQVRHPNAMRICHKLSQRMGFAQMAATVSNIVLSVRSSKRLKSKYPMLSPINMLASEMPTMATCNLL
jgi:hypothetical protein